VVKMVLEGDFFFDVFSSSLFFSSLIFFKKKDRTSRARQENITQGCVSERFCSKEK
jgi:hypothetical protein